MEGKATEMNGTGDQAKKKNFLDKFMTFLASGGFLLVLVLVAVIAILISNYL
jgi:hypothetical protein